MSSLESPVVSARLEVVFRRATPYEFASVVRLYDEGGYNGRYQAADFLLLAMMGDEAIGVVRLVEESQLSLLRGLYISKAWRGRGIGLGLLQAASRHLPPRSYCVTHSALLAFFGKIGFVPCSDEDAPVYLQERRRRYGWTGKTYHIMARP